MLEGWYSRGCVWGESSRGWGQLQRRLEGFVCEEEDFKLNTLWNWEPVEVLEVRSDMITGAGVGNQTCSGVLDVL